MTDEAAILSHGQLVAGRYRVGDELGRGGMAVVYEARHVELDRAVALKVLRWELSRSEKLRRRFMREARAAAKLESDHVALVLDVGLIDEQGGLPYIAMERLRGRNLGELIRERGPLPVAEAVDLVMQACVALAEAHARGIVHRDLKPSNMFLAQRDDGSARVKVLDFGIAKAMGGVGLDASLTRSQEVFGTPYYMSPEQLRGSAHVDARTDLWSLGVVLYELLSAEMPFAGGSVAEVHAAVLEKKPVPLEERREDVPAEVRQAIARCLMKDVVERFVSAAELARAIAPLGTERARWWLEGVERHGPAQMASSPTLASRVTEPSAGELPGSTLNTTGNTTGASTPAPLSAAQHTDTSWDSSTSRGRGRARPLLFAGAALGAVVLVVGGSLYALRDDGAPEAPATGTPARSGAATPEPQTAPPADRAEAPPSEALSVAPSVAASARRPKHAAQPPPGRPPAQAPGPETSAAPPTQPPPSPYDKRE